MAGILTIGVVLQNWLEDESLRNTLAAIIKNPIIREISIFRDATKPAITQDQAGNFITTLRGLRPDIAIAIDHEGGLVQRLRGEGFTQLPKPDELRQLYANGQQNKAREIAKACGTITAYELGGVGITILYGPVFDTYNENAAVMGKLGRSYGNPPASTDLLQHYLLGVDGCLYTTAKHFPDHGQVTKDTHFDIAIDDRSPETIIKQSLPPYQNLSYDALMIPHVIYSAIEPIPATLSKKTIQYFTDALGEKKPCALFSDALEMKALAKIAPTIIERIERCLNSGCDAILYCSDENYFAKLTEVLTYIGHKKKENAAFAQRYQQAEAALANLLARPLTVLPSKATYEAAVQTISVCSTIVNTP